MKRRLAAVLAIAVRSSASAFAAWAADHRPESEEQDRVRERREHADRREPKHLPAEARLGRRERQRPGASCGRREGAGRRLAGRRARSRRCRRASRDRRPSRPGPRGSASRRARRARAAPCRRTRHGHDQRQQLTGAVGADRLEPALRVGEPRAEGDVQDRVVAAGDQLALRSAHDPRAAGEPGADREVAVSREQGCDQRQERRQVGREIDVHVGEHAGVARAPDGVERAAAPLQIQANRPHRAELGGKPRCDLPGAVGAGVVGDRDPGRERESRGQVLVQPPDARLERSVLVEDGDDDLDFRRVVRRRHRRRGGLCDLGCLCEAHPEQCPGLPLQLPERPL